MLKVNHIKKSFKNLETTRNIAIQDITFEATQGEFIVLLGPSGCGKSTLLKLIAGLEHPDMGTVELDGKIVSHASKDRGMIFQQFALFPWLTVAENIAFGLRLTKTPSEEINKVVSRYLSLTGLSGVKDRYPNTLSGGMQQRVAIARTLANNPEVVLLDEPFGSLDVQTRSQMQEFLANLWQEEKKTMIMVTHDIEEALYLADVIVVMETKPGMVKEIVRPNLPRPRTSDLKFGVEFTRLKKHLSYLIHSEAIKAAWDIGSHGTKHNTKISVNVWPGSSLLYLGKDLGYFDEAGLPIELINIEKDKHRHNSWLKGEVDLLDTTLDTAVLLAQQEPDLRIILMKDVSKGGDALIANMSINNINELRGKTIAAEENWVSHFFLLYLLEKHGLSQKDVQIINMKGSDIGSAIISGKVDAGVVWEPWLSKTLELSTTHILADTSNSSMLYDCIVARQNYLGKNPDVLTKLKKAWKQSINFLKSNPAESYKIMSAFVGMPQRDLESQFNKLVLLDGLSPLKTTELITQIQAVYKQAQVITRPRNPSDMIPK